MTDTHERDHADGAEPQGAPHREPRGAPHQEPQGAPHQEPQGASEHSRAEAQNHAGLANARQGALGQRMGVEFLELREGYARARLPVEGNTQPVGLLHGGASVVLAESLGSIAATFDARPLVAVGTEVSASHHRPATSGWVTATCTPLHRGRTQATYHIEIHDDDGRRTCTVRLTCALRQLPAGHEHLFDTSEG